MYKYTRRNLRSATQCWTIRQNNSTLSTGHSSRSCGFVPMLFDEQTWCFHGFLQATIPNNLYSYCLLLIVLSYALTFYMLGLVPMVWDAVLCFSGPWGKIAMWRLAAVLNTFHLRINLLTVECQIPKCLEMLSYPFPECCKTAVAFLRLLLMSTPLGIVLTHALMAQIE